ncbi:hypothetical protein [Kribbella sp. HUAS MG21]|uniref:Secreted protein n=1 Tax=Kribbella sp. HUAS MG21 TaxID=3160966 RepID=A0AAU7THN7_9ACTN
MENRRTRARRLATAALVLGYSATAACSGDSAGPTAPSPGLNSARTSVPGTRTPATTTPRTTQTKPGIELVAVPRPDGSFDITEKVLLPAATDMLTLQLPASGENLPGLMTRTRPRVTNLKVTADEQSVPLEETTIPGADFIPLSAATRIQLTYRLTGSTVLATPARSTRAGAALRPLTASAEGTLPTDVTVTSGLLNAVCPLLTETRCAVGDPPRLRIQPDIPASKALVVLQLDLPR